MKKRSFSAPPAKVQLQALSREMATPCEVDVMIVPSGVTEYIGSSTPARPMARSQTQSQVLPRSRELIRPNVVRSRTTLGSVGEKKIAFDSGKRPFAWAVEGQARTARPSASAAPESTRRLAKEGI